MASKKSSITLGPVVVIFGCGFVGYHIVQALLKEPTCGPVSVISRTPNMNRCEGISCYIGDVGNLDKIRELLAAIKSRIISHAVAPRAGDLAVRPGDHDRVSVGGTKNVLTCATESPTAKALVYTSTCAVSKRYQRFNINETTPLWDQDSKTIPYLKNQSSGGYSNT